MSTHSERAARQNSVRDSAEKERKPQHMMCEVNSEFDRSRGAIQTQQGLTQDAEISRLVSGLR